MVGVRNGVSKFYVYVGLVVTRVKMSGANVVGECAICNWPWRSSSLRRRPGHPGRPSLTRHDLQANDSRSQCRSQTNISLIPPLRHVNSVQFARRRRLVEANRQRSLVVRPCKLYCDAISPCSPLCSAHLIPIGHCAPGRH